MPGPSAAAGCRLGLLPSRRAAVRLAPHRRHQGAAAVTGQKPLEGDAFCIDFIFLRGTWSIWSFL